MTSTDRFLLVAPQSPYSEASGAQQRTRLFYDALCAHGPTDVLVVSRDEDSPDAERDTQHGNIVYVRSSRKAAGWRTYRPDPELTARAVALLPVPLESYRLIVGRYLWSLCQLDLPNSVRSIVDLDDFSYRFSRHALASAGLWRTLLQRRVQESLARRQLARFDGFVFVSQRDHASVPSSISVVCPNIVQSFALTKSARTVAAHHSLLFVGSMWYGPNRDGIRWFLDKVWPIVRAGLPDARLTIVGAAHPDKRAEWARSDGVSAPGFVDDLAATYASATAVIVPVQYGGGTNIKLLEALVHGKPCVSSAFAQAPFQPWLQHGKHLLVADSAQEFAVRCIEVLKAAEPGSSLAQEGRRQVLDVFCAERFQAEFDRLLLRLQVTGCDRSRGEIAA